MKPAVEADGAKSNDYAELTAEVVAAYVSNNTVELAAMPDLIASVSAAFRSGAAPQVEAKPAAPLVPAVPIRKSVTDDFIICLEDGKKFKSLRRHLMTDFGLTPAEYRARWDLPDDYPMVAPAYAASRSALAKAFGLGSKRWKAAAEASPAPELVVETAKPVSKRRAPRRAKEAAQSAA